MQSIARDVIGTMTSAFADSSGGEKDLSLEIYFWDII